MSREEVLAALGERDTQQTGATGLEVEDQQIDHEPPSPTALKLDDWALRRGKDVLATSELMQKVFELDGKQFDYRKLRGEKKDRFNELSLQAADFHAAVFEPDPQLAKNCADPRRHQFMQQLLETAEYKALHQDTMLDEAASEMAGAAFAKQWTVLSKEAPQEGFAGEMQGMKAAGQALSQAKQQVNEMRDAQDALGAGAGALSAKEFGDLFKKVRKDQRLRQIIALAGRYRRLAQAKQRSKTLHGRDDMVGVVLDGDIARLLPQELVSLCDPDLELDAMRRIVERQAMCRDYRGIESVAKGPIVVVVDESGSMDGDKIHTAKALALALAWVARQQQRWCCLVGFSDDHEGHFHVCLPSKPDTDGLMAWLEHFYGGGTNPTVPLATVPGKWNTPLQCPKGKTDMILITDGLLHVDANMEKGFLAWKALEQVKLITMIIGERSGGDLAKVSDRLHLVNSLSLEEEAVGEVVSV